MQSKKACVLTVDDDIHILRLMQRILEMDGYRVLKAINGEAALAAFEEENPDVVLLDVVMPGKDGYDVCREIREFSHVPVIMVTVSGSDQAKVEGLDVGADDYVTKPFSPSELLARVKAVLRRTRLWDEPPESAFSSDGLEVDFARHRVTLNGREISLTGTEYRLLSYLARNADRVVTPDQILEKVWGDRHLGEVNMLQVNMARLRRKLQEDSRRPRHIVTRHGIGYTMLRQA